MLPAARIDQCEITSINLEARLWPHGSYPATALACDSTTVHSLFSRGYLVGLLQVNPLHTVADLVP